MKKLLFSFILICLMCLNGCSNEQKRLEKEKAIKADFKEINILGVDSNILARGISSRIRNIEPDDSPEVVKKINKIVETRKKNLLIAEKQMVKLCVTFIDKYGKDELKNRFKSTMISLNAYKNLRKKPNPCSHLVK